MHSIGPGAKGAIEEVFEESLDSDRGQGLTLLKVATKRTVGVLIAAVGLTRASWLIGILWVAATIYTGSNGFFPQRHVGRCGRQFTIIKLRTIGLCSTGSSITVSDDPRVTRLGRTWRRSKIDELPQLLNVFIGQMGFFPDKVRLNREYVKNWSFARDILYICETIWKKIDA